MSLVTVALSLFACYDDPIAVTPVEPRAQLESGLWEVQVVDVGAMTCEGMRPRDVIGESLQGELQATRGEVRFAIEGWILEGQISGNNLYVEGTMDRGGRGDPERYDDDDTDTDVGDREGEDSGEDTGGSRGEGGGQACPAEPEPDEEFESFLSIDATILDDRVATGRLEVAWPGCEMDLDIVMTWTGRGDEPVVVVAETEDVPQDEPGEATETD